MTQIHTLWLRRQQERWLRPDAQRWLRPGFTRKYDPDQPRVPAGHPDGGQWTDANGNPVERQPFDPGGREDSARERLIRLAGEIPTDDTPEIPKERPPTERERNRIARTAVQRSGRAALALQAADWLVEKAAEIQSFYDPPRPLDQLQRSLQPPEKGYDDHHILLRSSRKADGSEDHIIFAAENIVRIPRWKHWDINKWYETPNRDYGGLRPREYLKNQSLEVRRQVGLKVLRDHGVLK